MYPVSGISRHACTNLISRRLCGMHVQGMSIISLSLSLSLSLPLSLPPLPPLSFRPTFLDTPILVRSYLSPVFLLHPIQSATYAHQSQRYNTYTKSSKASFAMTNSKPRGDHPSACSGTSIMHVHTCVCVCLSILCK